jgi:hypothetical protein
MGEGSVTLATFKQLLDTLAQQQAGIEELLLSSDVDIIRVNVTGLKQALLPWPKSRLQELQQLLPQLASGEATSLDNSLEIKQLLASRDTMMRHRLAAALVQKCSLRRLLA